jgi:ankyrin repeat protein
VRGPNKDDGPTPVFWAAPRAHDAVVARLLAGGAAVDLADNDGITPLCKAAQNGRTAAAQQLLAAGAALAPGGTDWSPLRLAEYGKHDSVVALLRARAQ